MPGATFAPIGKPGVVQAARDFQANPSAQTYNRSSKVKPTNPTHVSAKFAREHPLPPPRGFARAVRRPLAA